MNAEYQQALARLSREWGSKFVAPTGYDPTMLAHFRGQRVEVTSPSGFARRGVISITTGWVPYLMLMHRANARGSWDLLKPGDRVTALIGARGKRFPL